MASMRSLALLAAPASVQQSLVAPPHLAKLAHTVTYWGNYDIRVRMGGQTDRVVLEDFLRKPTAKT